MKKLPSYAVDLGPEPMQPQAPKSSKKLPNYAKDMGEAPIQVPSPMESAGEVLTQTGALLDIPGAAARSTLMGEGGQFLKNLPKMGSRAVFEAPTGEEILSKAGMPESLPESLKTIGGVATEIALDPLMVAGAARRALQGVGKPLGGVIKHALEKPMQKQTAKALARIRPVSESLMGKGMDTEKMAATMVENDLVRYINKPRRLLEVIGGAREIEKVPAAGGRLIKKSTSPKNIGKIREFSNDLEEVVGKISDRELVPYNGKAVKFNVNEKFKSLMEDKTSASGLLEEDLSKIDNILSTYVKPDADYTIKDLFNLKKNLNKQLDSRYYFQPESKSVALEKEVMLELERNIDDLIKNELSRKTIQSGKQTVNAGEYYSLQNNRMHNMINIKELLKSVPEKELRDPSMASNISALVARALTLGGAGAVAEGMGFQGAMGIGALGGAGWEASRMAERAVTKKFPETMARGMDMVSKVPEIAVPISPQMQRMVTDEQKQRQINTQRYGRSPDSYNLPLNLVKTKMPRTIEGIMQNKDVFLAKVAQQAPQYFDQAKFVIEQRPEDLEEMLPMMIQILPHAFEKDKYNRVNNMILDPLMAQKAREDLANDPNLSNTQRFLMMDKLNRTNILEDY